MESHVYWAPATDRVPSLGQNPLEKGMDTHSGIVAWRIPWTEEPVAYHPWSLKESDMTEQQTCSALVVINLFFYLNSFTLVYLCIYIVCMYICMYVLYAYLSFDSETGREERL